MSDQLKMHSPNLVDSNIEKIAALFPNCVTEAQGENGELKKAIDFDLLKQELSQVIVDGEQERYRLDWVGKKEAILAANMPIKKTLRPSRDQSINFDSTQNLFIEGDNLEVLKTLQESYLNKVDVIYIDPPYNTGRNIIYKNDYSISEKDYLLKSQDIDEEGNIYFTNKESNGRFHSDWLSMIYSRLKLAKNLLKENGVLICAIDENEQPTLSILLKEIFNEGSYEHHCITIVHNPRGIQGTNFSYTHEFAIFVVPKGKKRIANRKIEDEDVDWSNLRNWGSESERTDAKNCFYPIVINKDSLEIIDFGDVCPDDFHPKFNEIFDNHIYIYPIDRSGIERKWRYARQSVESIKSMLKVKKTKEGYDIQIGKNFGLYKTVWNDTRYDANEYGTKIVNSLVENSSFTYPKSLWTVYDCIYAGCADNKDALILDFFAGSSTTAHATYELNKQDNGNRKFIMVQVPAEIPEENKKLISGFQTIADISRERIRKAAKNYENLVSDIGVRALYLDDTCFKDVFYLPDVYKQSDLVDLASNIKEDRTSEDLLFQVMLDWGLELSLPIERKAVAGKEVFYVAGNSLVACFDELNFDVVDEVAKDHPLRFVSAEKAIHLDHDKTNIKERFKQLSPDTEVKFL